MSTTTRATEADSIPPQPQGHAAARLAWPEGIDPGVALAEARVPIMLISGADRAVSFNESCIDLAHAHGLAVEAMSTALQEAGRDCIEAAFCGNAIACRPIALPAPHARASASAVPWFKLSCTPLHTGKGRVAAVLCIVMDVTVQVRLGQRVGQLEDAARARETENAIVYSNMEEVVYHAAVESGERFRFVSVNQAFYKATGLSEGDVIGKLLHEVIPEPSYSLVLERYREAIASRATVQWEEATACPTGRKVGSVSVTPVLDAFGNCTDLIGTVHDITARKDSEDALRVANAELEHAGQEQARLANDLRVSEQRLAFALDSTGEGVWDWNISGNSVFYSTRFLAILGLCDGSRTDTGYWWDRVHPEDVPDPVRFVDGLLSSKQQAFVCEHRLRHAAGHWIWVQTRGSIVARAPDGTPQRMVGTIADITATKLLRQQLEHSYEVFAKLTQQVPGALFELVMQPGGRLSCTFISAMSEEIFERTPQQIQDDINCLHSRIYRPDRTRLRHSLHEAARRLQSWHVDYRVMLPTKGVCWRELSAKPTCNDDGSIVWHGFTTDISERKNNEQTIRQFNEKLERRAHYDGLTGLPNRVLFRDRLEQEMKHAQGAAHSMGLLFIDLDRFKEVNDLLGHDAGDMLLADAARRIEACLRPGDTVARLGGDEFTVILTEMAELSHIEQTAQAILDVLRQPFQLGIEQAYVSASIGITVYPGDGRGPEELMRNADHAMYRSKGAGRNQLTFFESAMQEAAMRRLKLTSELRRAQAEHQLELHFQPIIDSVTGTVFKAEALLRWRRPGGVLALPADFVGIAEETGLIHEIGNWVFCEAARWSQRWSGMLGRPFQVSINKSPVQFQPHARSMDWVRYLDQAGMPHNSIAVEITEGLLLNLTDEVFDKLHELQQGGMEVSIDDFGTGYSSMSYLKRLDIDYLKIDRSFVSEMMHDPTSQTITETIIVMAHKLGLKVIAEGVESTEQRDWLASQQCDFVQGFLFGQPLEPAAFEQLLGEQPFMRPEPAHQIQFPS